jgi:hypothetical protein
MMKYLILAVLALMGMLLIASCSSPFGGESTVDTDHHPGVNVTTLPPSPGSDFVSASVQGASTSSGKFIIYGSLGAANSGVQNATPHGYLLFSNIQGQIISNGKGL